MVAANTKNNLVVSWYPFLFLALVGMMCNKITGPKVYIMDVVSNQIPATNDHKIFSDGCVEKVLK
jgi:hypothetical protein